jgi:uncharacterized protein (DUF302 family)
MTVNLALPCRISVYEEGGKVKIGMVRPTALLLISLMFRLHFSIEL